MCTYSIHVHVQCTCTLYLHMNSGSLPTCTCTLHEFHCSVSMLCAVGGCLYLSVCHPPTQSGGDHPGTEHLWPARPSLQSQHCTQTHPGEEMVSSYLLDEHSQLELLHYSMFVIHLYLHVHVHVYTCMYIVHVYMYMYRCMCVYQVEMLCFALICMGGFYSASYTCNLPQ